MDAWNSSGILLVYIAAAFITLTSTTLSISFGELKHASAAEVRGPYLSNLFFIGKWLFNSHSPPVLQFLSAAVALAGFAMLLRRDTPLVLYLSGPLIILFAFFTLGLMWFLTARYCILGLLPVSLCHGVFVRECSR